MASFRGELRVVVAGFIGFLLTYAVGVGNSEEAKQGATRIAVVEVQIDSPFSPFMSKGEERRYALKNDHIGGRLNPLPKVWVQVDAADAFNDQLVPSGNRMIHIYYGRGTAEVASDASTFVVRVRVESQHIDERVSMPLSKGRFVVITQAPSKALHFAQFKHRPLYR